MAGSAPNYASLTSDPGANYSWISVSQQPASVGDPAACNGGNDLEAQMKVVREKKADVRKRLADLGQLPSSSTGVPSAISKAAIAKRAAAVNSLLSRRQNGIDIAVVLDITGSMAPHLQAAQSKIKEIYKAVKVVHPQAEARVAFVGYRDYGTEGQGSYQFQVMDFVPYSRSNELVGFLESLRAGGGFGGCADVAGGLQKAVGFSWEAHTRLVVHFADIAAHGSRYNKRAHSHHQGVAHCCSRWADNQHPSGDAATAVADLMRKNINYYFGEICPHETDKMTSVFHEIAVNMPKIFQVFPADATATDFVTVLESSLRSSMSSMGFGANIDGSKDSSAIKAAAAAHHALDPSIEKYLEF